MDYREMLVAYRRGEGRTFRVTKDDVEVFTFTFKFRNPDEDEDEDFYLQIDIQERESTWNNTPLPVHAVDIAGFEFEVVKEDIPKNQIIAVLDPEGLTEEVYEFGAMHAWSTMKSQMMTRREAWGELQEFLQENPDFTPKVVYEAPR